MAAPLLASPARAPARSAPPALPERQFRGVMVEIGEPDAPRRIRVVQEGAGPGPVVLFEAGSFGMAADWAVVQDLIAPRMRTLAYDRAGLGVSDPGPEPRTSEAIVADLAATLTVLEEPGPFILVAHSMAPVHACMFALTRPEQVAGMVLVDGFPPASLDRNPVRGMVEGYNRVLGPAPLAAKLGLTWIASPVLGDRIGVPGLAGREKRAAFASARHQAISTGEVRHWAADGVAVRALGDLDMELPVAVITAGRGPATLKRLQEEPARRSRSGYCETVAAANHANLLGHRFAPAIVRGIDHVRRAALARGA